MEHIKKDITSPKLIFVVGFPRSGTKLLMELLKTHAQIGGPSFEVNIAHLLSEVNFSESLEALYNKSSLYLNNEANQLTLDFEKILSDNLENTYCNFLKAASTEKEEQLAYLVDKSPRYITHIERLLASFPESKIIHLVRNVRDVVSSHAKAWGKSKERCADQWNKSVLRASEVTSNRLLHLKYEDLTGNPQLALSTLHNFLEVNGKFDVASVDSGEKHGKVRSLGLSQTQREHVLVDTSQRIIEQLAFEGLQRFEYPIFQANEQSSYLFYRRFFNALWDQYAVLRFHIKEKGILAGIRYFVALH